MTRFFEDDEFLLVEEPSIRPRLAPAFSQRAKSHNIVRRAAPLKTLSEMALFFEDNAFIAVTGSVRSIYSSDFKPPGLGTVFSGRFAISAANSAISPGTRELNL